MTSSKFLKGGLGKGFAFPIMLAAVGLLLASLVLGLNTNFVRALGDGNNGICNYSDDLREAILANTDNADNPELCDTEFDGTADTAFWGGVDSDDKPKDLDLTGVSAFAPLTGELDGFTPGSRVDLRGTGLTTADLDVGNATGTNEGGTGAGIANQFGPTIGVGNGTSTGTTTNPVGLGLTFLLDGGSETANGFVSEAYEGVEGEIAWITFQYSAKPGEFTDFNNDGDADGSVWARVRLTIETIPDSRDDGATPPGPATETVDLVINSKDAAGTIYAVPYRIRDNAVNRDGDTEDLDISAALVDVGTFSDVTDGTLNIETTDRFDTDVFDKSIRDARRAELIATDEDAPAVYVSDRQRFIADAIEDVVGLNARKIGIDQLAGIDDPDGGTDNLLVALDIDGFTGAANDEALDAEDKLTAISPNDLSGLTGLSSTTIGTIVLDLSHNKLTTLPTGLFADVGKSNSDDLTTLIDLTGNDGPEGEGFTLTNIGVVGNELIAGQILKVDLDGDSDDRIGILNDALEATEGGVLVFDVNIRPDPDGDEAATVMIQFKSLNDDSGKDDDTAPSDLNLSLLDDGNYRIAVKAPENDDDADKTWTALFGHGDGTNITTLLGVTPVTIRDASYEAPMDVPVAPGSSFDSVIITNNEFNSEVDNQILHHNISNVLVTVGGEALEANFLDFFNNTGGVERWGYPSSELVEIESGTLTQFFQRGVIDFHDTGSGYIVERRLAWDYVGGHLGENDQGVEPVPDTAPEGGVQVGAFNHYVANVDADGNATGFLDFFNRLGGVDAFGYPKTEAREDTGDAGMLLAPGSDTGFTRQYFQAAVFQLNAEGGVELTLLGDELRNILVPGFADEPAFGQG